MNNRIFYKYLISFLLLFIIVIKSAFSQWEQLSTPNGESINRIYSVNDTSLFAIGGNYNIYHFNTSFEKWENITFDLIDLKNQIFPSINSIDVFQNKIYLTTNNGLFSKDYNAKIWTKTVLSTKLDKNISHIEISDKYVIVISNKMFYLSKDSMKSFNQIFPDKNNDCINCLFGDLKIENDTVYFSTNQGVYYSSLDTINWEFIKINDLGYAITTSLELISNDIFVACQFGLYKAKKTDSVFINITDSNSFTNLRYIKRVKSTLFVSNYYGVFYSKDKGSTWSKLNKLKYIVEYYSLANFNDELIINSIKGIFKYNVDNKSFGKFEDGLRNYYISDITCYKNKIFAINYTGEKLYCSQNNGRTWISLQFNDRITWVKTFDTFVYIGLSKNRILRTSVSNIDFKLFLNKTPGNDFAILDSNIFILAGEDFLFSNDFGKSWERKNNGLPDTYSNDLYSLTIIGNKLFIAIKTNGVYFSPIDSITWHKFNNGLPYDPNPLHHYPTMINMEKIDTFLYSPSSSGLFRTALNNHYWGLISNGLPKKNNSFRGALGEIKYFGNTILIVTFCGVYKSDDKGASWQIINDGLNSERPINFASNDSFVFMGTYGNGLWRRNKFEIIDTSTNSIINKKEVKSVVKLYPNPATDKVTIRLNTNSSENFCLNIFDIAGKQVLAKEFKDANTKAQTIDLKEFKSGLYLFQIVAGSKVITKKLIISY
ncbi:MAG: T9SS type A sorting domain-containing protein [Bacteroidota bacterium]|nr:T9SS type A sorting domain-containing protein [Bacteroidota bacterium]